MKLIRATLILIIGISFPAYGQSLIQALARQQVQSCLDQEKDCSIPADALAALNENQVVENSFNGVTCIPTPSPAPPAKDEVTTTVLLVSEVRSLGQHLDPTRKDYLLFTKDFVESAFELRPYFANDQEWVEMISEGSNAEYAEIVKRTLNTSLLIRNGSALASQNPPLNENQIARSMAGMIQQMAASDDEKMALLTSLSSVLYDNYNSDRNPLQNKNKLAPQGNISLGDMMKAANAFDPTKGGVCNDIAQSVATVAKEVFPDRDVLVINNGSHFGVLIDDHHHHHQVINWNQLYSNDGEVSLGANIPTTNTRISKMVDGKLKEIAVTETEVGAVFNKMFGNPRPGLQTGVDPSVVYATIERESENSRRKMSLEGKIGVAETSQSKMIVLVGQRTVTTQKSRFDVGYGAAFQKLNAGDQNAIFVVREGYERNLIHYVSPRVTLKVSSGLQLEGQIAKHLSVKDPDEGLSEVTPFSANAQLIQKLQVDTHPQNPNAPQFSGTAQVIHAIGSNDFGARQGAISNPGLGGILKSFKYTNLHLNQVFVDGTVKVPLRPNLISQTTVQYQGSNIGQRIDVSSGVEIQSSGGMKIFAFVGYVKSDLKGFQTQGSLLTDGTGLKSGVMLQTPKGARFGISRTPSNSFSPTPLTNLNAVIPVFQKKRKK